MAKTNNSIDKFQQKQAKMSDNELIKLAEKEVSELARTYGQSHKMCIPPMVTDTDMLLSELIRRFKSRCEGKPVSDEPQAATCNIPHVSDTVCPKCKGQSNSYIHGFRTYCDRCGGTGEAGR